MSMISHDSYDSMTCSVNYLPTISTTEAYSIDLNPITHTYITSVGRDPTENKNKGEKTMPTGIISGEIKYSLIRERPIFNADGSIKKVVFSGPATIVIWKDGTKTVVKCMEGDDYDPEKGLMMCIMEKLLGGKSAVKKLFKKHIPEEDTSSICETLANVLDSLASFTVNHLSSNDHKEENEE